MYYISKRMEISGSHSLSLPYESKCTRMHGHNWIITVYCCAERLDDSGMVADFTRIRTMIHDRLDHRHLNDIVEFNPTAENIARWVVEQIDGCYKCRVQESEGNEAMYVDDVLAAQCIGGL